MRIHPTTVFGAMSAVGRIVWEALEQRCKLLASAVFLVGQLGFDVAMGPHSIKCNFCIEHHLSFTQLLAFDEVCIFSC
jgi:hypothetical protein